jgi:hypothetical protein
VHGEGIVVDVLLVEHEDAGVLFRPAHGIGPVAGSLRTSGTIFFIVSSNSCSLPALIVSFAMKVTTSNSLLNSGAHVHVLRRAQR